MSVQRRARPRRRDVSSHRNSLSLLGIRRSTATRGEARPNIVRASSSESRLARRPVETRNIIRLDGDSIAYFWALETETAISYETLIRLWREFAEVLTDSWHSV